MFTATLRCGRSLAYEVRSFLPSVGQSVPCRHHGYCIVDGLGSGDRREAGGPGVPRARPRAQHELLDWLTQTPVTTVAALRRHRFTLRMIAVAERAGHVNVDLRTGQVALRNDEGTAAGRHGTPPAAIASTLNRAPGGCG
jgi:hypothetical protein